MLDNNFFLGPSEFCISFIDFILAARADAGKEVSKINALALFLRKSISFLDPATYPPTDPTALDKVPIHISMSP